MPQVSPVEAAKAVESGAGVFLDVREPWEREQMHIRGSLAIPMRDLQARFSELPEDQDVYVYCQHGVRSLRAVDFLMKSGRSRAIDVAGGMSAWRQAGLPA
jgi:rhodanese-related sulfurtransferase